MRINRNLRLTWIKHCCSKNSQESEGSLGTEGVSSRQVLLMKCTLLIEHLEEKALLWKQKCCQLAGQVCLGVCWLIAKEEMQRGPTFCPAYRSGKGCKSPPIFLLLRRWKNKWIQDSCQSSQWVDVTEFFVCTVLGEITKNNSFSKTHLVFQI